MISFPIRPKISQSVAARRRIWQSGCGRFRVVHSHCKFGPARGRQAIMDRYYAMQLTEWGWGTLSVHRRPGPAFKACQRAARGARRANG